MDNDNKQTENELETHTNHTDDHHSEISKTTGSDVLLDAIEARVLGVLMEKQQTTPEQYPLTLNSTLLGCNQKSSREPKMNLTEGEVGHCLRVLENREFVRVDMGGRANRYEHKMNHQLMLDKPLQALLTLLLLRGPQTINELYTRSQRAYEFSDISAVEDALDRLIERASPLVIKVHRQAGQREDRYAHLLCGEVDPGQPQPENTAQNKAGGGIKPSRSSALSEQSARIEALEAKVATLEALVSQLQATLDEVL